MTPSQERKIARDKDRKRKGKKQRRFHKILLDPTQHAFPGWAQVEGPWTLKTCKWFIAWCHIGHLFPHYRHEFHRRLNCANLHYCLHDEFVQRCIEVWKFLYAGVHVVSNEVSYNIAQMVYAEIILEREVDWRTLKKSPQTIKPTQPNIPRAPYPAANPREGLTTPRGYKRGIPDEDIVWSDSEEERTERQEVDEEEPDQTMEEGGAHFDEGGPSQACTEGGPSQFYNEGGPSEE